MQSFRDVFDRFTSRKFILTVVVLYLIYTRPEMSVEQIIGLLSAAGIFVVTEGAADIRRAKTDNSS